jgi:hypothetical protein
MQELLDDAWKEQEEAEKTARMQLWSLYIGCCLSWVLLLIFDKGIHSPLVVLLGQGMGLFVLSVAGYFGNYATAILKHRAQRYQYGFGTVLLLLIGIFFANKFWALLLWQLALLGALFLLSSFLCSHLQDKLTAVGNWCKGGLYYWGLPFFLVLIGRNFLQSSIWLPLLYVPQVLILLRYNLHFYSKYRTLLTAKEEQLLRFCVGTTMGISFCLLLKVAFPILSGILIGVFGVFGLLVGFYYFPTVKKTQ